MLFCHRHCKSYRKGNSTRALLALPLSKHLKISQSEESELKRDSRNEQLVSDLALIIVFFYFLNCIVRNCTMVVIFTFIKSIIADNIWKNLFQQTRHYQHLTYMVNISSQYWNEVNATCPNEINACVYFVSDQFNQFCFYLPWGFDIQNSYYEGPLM